MAIENLKEMEKDNRLFCLFILFFVNIKFRYGWKERGNQIDFFLKKKFFLTSESQIQHLGIHVEIHLCPKYILLLRT